MKGVHDVLKGCHPKFYMVLKLYLFALLFSFFFFFFITFISRPQPKSCVICWLSVFIAGVSFWKILTPNKAVSSVVLIIRTSVMLASHIIWQAGWWRWHIDYSQTSFSSKILLNCVWFCMENWPNLTVPQFSIFNTSSWRPHPFWTCAEVPRL